MDGYPITLRKKDPRTLEVVWSTGEVQPLEVRALRLACPCASCVDEWTGVKRLKDESVPQDIQPVRMETIGRYALRVYWSDGHDTGMYPFRKLRGLGDNSGRSQSSDSAVLS